MSRPDGTPPPLPLADDLACVERLELRPSPSSVPEARRFVLRHTAGLPSDLRDNAALLTSELVTNGVIHARTDLVVTVVLTAEHVAVRVHDLDLGRREQRGTDRDGGRGLPIVQSLACASGQDVHSGGGKTSWFRLCRTEHVGHSSEEQG